MVIIPVIVFVREFLVRRGTALNRASFDLFTLKYSIARVVPGGVIFCKIMKAPPTYSGFMSD